MKLVYSFFSYLIIVTTMFVIGWSVNNSVHAIQKKDISLYSPTMPKIEIDIFGPLVESVMAAK